MSWKLSRFRAGELVVVRSREEILATLDENGCFDGMPFMPEMLKFCDKEIHVRAVAHKTCDTERKIATARRVAATVHLTATRCDGSAHGGCQAECTLFWKDEWLRPHSDIGGEGKTTCAHLARGCTQEQLQATTFLPLLSPSDQPCYSCQATKLYDASEYLPWWDLRQYFYDVWTGNHSLGRVLRTTWLGLLRWLLRMVPFGYRIFLVFTHSMHRLLTGRNAPSLHGKIARGVPTPVGKLDLKVGEYVRIKSQVEIEQTIDETGRNRGLTFDPEEMAPYCGKVFRVRKSVTQIIDEPTGKMRIMKQPCIMLEGVVCKGEYAGCRLGCPREIPSYWREIWVERVTMEEAQSIVMTTEAVGKSIHGADAAATEN